MDLLSGELSPAEEGSLRAAIQDCSECGAEFEMMALLMDFSGPALQASAPKELDAVIMAAAKAHVEQVHADEVLEPSVSIWSRLGGWLESVAIGPQFAMATVMVLVVAVGFWYVPKHESHEVAGSTVVLSDPEGEAVAADDPGPTRALLGAGETRQEVEEPSFGRAADGNAEVTPETEPEPVVVAPVEDTTSLRPSGRNEANNNMRRRPPVQNTERRAPEQTVRTHTDMAMTRGVTRMTVPPARMIQNQGNDDVENLHQQSAAWAEELEGLPMPSYADDAPARPSAPPSQAQAPAVQTQTEGSASMGGAWQPEEVAPPSNTSSPSRALLQLARSHRAQARCDQAVVQYESLLARFSSSPEVPQALMESADCYRRLGRISDAERALQRALQFASTRVNARRELTRLETIRAAQRESSAPSSQESFESAY